MGESTSKLISAGFLLSLGAFTAIDVLLTIYLILIAPWVLVGMASAVDAIISGINLYFGFAFFAVFFGHFAILFYSAWMLRSYARHINGTLSRPAVDRMWLTTIVQNGLLFLPSVYVVAQCSLSYECYTDCRPYDDCHWLLNLISENLGLFHILTLWWGFGTFAPFVALWSLSNE